MKEVETLTPYLAMAVIMLVSAFFAVLLFGIALYGQMADDDFEEPEYDPEEIDTTYYPDDVDGVIFRQ